MASIRKMCFNDLLHMDDILMGRVDTTGKDSYESLLYHDILRDPEYALVAVSPGNRILGFITACIQEKDTETVCIIAGIFYGDAGFPEIDDMLIQEIMEKADKLAQVDFVEADVPSNNQGLLNFFAKHGFTWDGKQPEGNNKRLRKDLSRNGVLEAHDNSWFEATADRSVEDSGFSMTPSTSR